MPTAERFATTSSSYWNAILPRLEHFVRISNAGPRRFAPPIEWAHRPRRHALVSETAFYLWADHQRGDKPNLRRAIERATSRLTQVANQVDLGDQLDQDEIEVALMLAQRLNSYCTLTHTFTSIEVEPSLPGCGWISGGLPDLIANDYSSGISIKTLVEVKAVNRPFRSVDLRQMVAYVVLYFAAHQRIPDALAVVNPVKGVALEVGVSEFFADVVGVPSSEVINNLLVDWSTAGVSP
ncbi:hypothetical protein [Micromonospora sp. NPDC005305]|uniref:hypothetical protein n=1 Tax=Micromonospora sp. NPDC005305 TaxID=3156875 RepID=UPI0033B66A6F